MSTVNSFHPDPSVCTFAFIGSHCGNRYYALVLQDQGLIYGEKDLLVTHTSVRSTISSSGDKGQSLLVEQYKSAPQMEQPNISITYCLCVGIFIRTEKCIYTHTLFSRVQIILVRKNTSGLPSERAILAYINSCNRNPATVVV